MDHIGFDNTVEGVRLMAAFIAQLEKEGVAYSVKQNHAGFKVNITGH